MEPTPLSSAHLFHGRLETHVIESECLRGNPLGDDPRRDLLVYRPPRSLAGERLPVVLVLHGFTGRPHGWLESHPWKPRPLVALDRAMASGELPSVVLAMPDAFTRLGGSQYVNSSAVGRYADYVAGEVVAWLDRELPTLPGRRAVTGKSSGGFGALHLAMHYPGTFVALGAIAPDCNFEYGYGGELLAAARGLDAWGRDPRAFLAAFAERPSLAGDAHAILDLLAMSACYSPHPGSELGFDLPIDLETGERIPAVWERWRAFDPVVACERHASALRALELVYLEAGRRDEFHAQLSLRILVRRLRALGIACEHVEFDGGHFGIDERWEVVLARVARGLVGG